MKRIILATAALLCAASMAYATPMQLNYILDHSPIYDHGYSFGTVTVTDNVLDSNRVDLDVSLTNSGWKILGVYLNYDDAVLNGYYGKLLTTTGKTVGISADGEKAGGFSLGNFDLQDPANGNLGYLGTYHDTLYGEMTAQVLTGYQQKITGYQQKIISYQQKITGYNTHNGKPIYGNDLTKPIYGNDTSKPIYENDTTKPIYSYVVNHDALNLDALNFYTKDSSNNFYAAVHIGNYNGSSIWVASGDPAPVPEPGTMVLLGVGILGVAIFGKRRMSKEA